MILRRPYAFLVKHFKIIHAIILICASFIVYKKYNLVSFFGSYIRNSGEVSDIEIASSKYITPMMYILSVFIIIVCGIIIYLLRYKNKTIKTYLLMLGYYALLIISFYFLYVFLYGLQFTEAGIRTISIIRDLFRFTLLIDIAIIGFCFIRTLGFDLSKFDFKKDLLDLGIDEEDNEEYEFEFKFDKDEIKSKIKKKLRYFKYFYRENKYIFIILESVLIFVVVSISFKVVTGIEKIYKQNQNINTDHYTIKVIDSYKTRTNSFGSTINQNTYFVIAKVDITNKNNYDIIPGTWPFSLKCGDTIVYPTTKDLDRFSDFGVAYYNQTLKGKENRLFNYIFELPLENYNDSCILRFTNSVSYEKGELNYDYRKIKLSLDTFKKEPERVVTKKLGEEMSFEGSLLGNTKLTINDIELNDTFIYKISKCNEANCTTKVNSVSASIAKNFDLTLMRLNYKVEFDYDKLGKKYTNDTFIQKFGTMRFEYKGKQYNNRLELIDVTPYPTADYAFVQVRDKLKKADKIYLDFVIRDKIYTYVVKDTTVKEEIVEEKTDKE